MILENIRTAHFEYLYILMLHSVDFPQLFPLPNRHSVGITRGTFGFTISHIFSIIYIIIITYYLMYSFLYACVRI